MKGASGLRTRTDDRLEEPMLQGCLYIQYSYSRTWLNYSTVQKPKIDHFTFLIFPTGYVLHVAPFYLHLDRPPHFKIQLYDYTFQISIQHLQHVSTYILLTLEAFYLQLQPRIFHLYGGDVIFILE